MHRLLGPALVICLTLAGCRIEPTPSEFFDQQRLVPTERELATEELSARLSLLATTLSRADAEGALASLALSPAAFVIGPDDGELRSGPPAAFDALARITAEGPVEVIVREMRVSVGPRASSAWFAAHLESITDEGEERRPVLRMTGVFAQPEGFWQLVQVHMSYPTIPPPDLASRPTLTAGVVRPRRAPQPALQPAQPRARE